jgi:uncharacterized protein YndB with AHSA1/START domain
MTPPLRREVLVATSPDRAFAAFTERIGEWWPLARFSVFGDGTVAVEGTQIVERSGDRAAVWGDITVWEPPSAFGFTWHPGYGSERATDVRVTFESAGEQTLVTLVHTGWERTENPATSREEYGNGWPLVLAAFAEAA